MSSSKFEGVGLGYRREMSDDIEFLLNSDINFFEVAPENWMKLGGEFEQQLTSIADNSTLVTHGLSLSLGSPDPLDIDFVRDIKAFLKKYNIAHYTEHLSYCSADGHMYDLMPIPFTEEAVKYVADRIKQVQDILEQKIAIENVSYYLSQDNELSEAEFINAILNEADCNLLFDVNNVYVNSINHKYNAKAFIEAMPTHRILYGHIAGHYDEAEDLKVDTHGSDVIQPVWELLSHSYKVHGVYPTLLERDFNIPSTTSLIDETKMIRQLQQQAEYNLAAKVG